MKRLATGLLLLAILVYAAATALEPGHPWLYYVRAASEAAIIGAIADWFAVVALFRHPLGLRILPHTAIIPRNKARIAQGLSRFIQENFLSAEAVLARIAGFRPARSLCQWLLRQENAEALAGYATRLLAWGLNAFDDARVSRFLREKAADTLREADIPAAAAQLLDVLTQDGRHHALLDEALAGLDAILAREDTRRFIAAEVAQNAPLLKMLSDLFGLKLDEKAAIRIVEVAVRKISEVRRDRGHELRARFDGFVAGFIEKLKTDEGTRRKIFRIRDDALADPALGRYVDGLWRDFRAWLGADLGRERSAAHARIVEMLRSFGRTVEADTDIQSWIDGQILRALPPLVEEHRGRIGRFIEDQVNAWQEGKLVAELEGHVGADLQYIRINGTIVGALAGLLIAVLTQFAR